jgi:hypothetical protein
VCVREKESESASSCAERGKEGESMRESMREREKDEERGRKREREGERKREREHCYQTLRTDHMLSTLLHDGFVNAHNHMKYVSDNVHAYIHTYIHTCI